MRSRRSASCSPVMIFCRLSLIAVPIHSGRNQTCLTRLTIDWPMSFNSCTTCPNALVISDMLTARFSSIGLLDRGGDDEPFAFWGKAATLQNLDTNSAIEFAVGQNLVRHDDVGSFVEFIDNNVFNSRGFHQAIFGNFSTIVRSQKQSS